MYKYVLLFLSTILLQACITSSSNTNRNNRQANAEDTKLKTYSMGMPSKFKIINEAEHRYLLVESPIENYKLTIKLFKDYTDAVPVWEGTNLTLYPCPFAENYRYLALSQLATLGETPWVVWVKLENTATNTSIIDMLTVNPLQDNAQNLFLVNENGTLLHIDKYVKKGSTYRFMRPGKTVNNYTVHYYPKALPIALPAHSSQNNVFAPLKTERTTSVLSKDDLYTFEQTGTYLIQTDLEPNQGILITCVEADFPKITKVSQMVEAMRYLTKNEEYEALMNGSNQKLELDNFWMKMAKGNVENAKILLRSYFKRVEFANYYFTAEKEGWRTDRGIVYIVFGTPTLIKKTAKSENWYYRLYNGSTLYFNFTKIGEIYALNRESNYGPIWNDYIRMWRNGEIRE